MILFDHGPGGYHRMMEAGIKATQENHVFFSRLHYDHCLNHARLVLTRWDQGAGGILELKVFGPVFIKRMTEFLFAREGVYGPDLTARKEHALSLDICQARGGVLPRRWPLPEVRESGGGSVVEEKGWQVKAAGVPHVQPHLICLGYRFEAPEGIFVYSGDTGPSEGMVKPAEGCDALVHMCHYLSGSELSPDSAMGTSGHLEVARVAQQAGAKNLVVSHVTEQMDWPGVRERVIREMAEICTGNLFFGADPMEIPLAGPEPAKLN